jgi:uncharacterized membrane protein SpoIIM required for sporulation
MLLTPYNISSVNKTEILTKEYNNYVNNQIPELSNSFLRIFSGNLRSGLIVLLLPGLLYIFAIWIIFKMKQYPTFFLKFEEGNMKKLEEGDAIKFFTFLLKSIILMITVYFALVTFSVNNMYVYFSILPLNVALSAFPHAIFEIPAMLIPCVMSLYTIDMIYEISQENDKVIKKSKIKKLFLELILIILLIVILLLIAAYLECFVSPKVFQQALGNYLLNR